VLRRFGRNNGKPDVQELRLGVIPRCSGCGVHGFKPDQEILETARRIFYEAVGLLMLRAMWSRLASRGDITQEVTLETTRTSQRYGPYSSQNELGCNLATLGRDNKCSVFL
jgi:hypothetical protein